MGPNKNVSWYWWFSMTIASYRCCAKMIPIPIHILARGIIQTMPTWKCLGFFFAKYPPKSPRIQRLKFVCTCPTTCPSRTTRTLNSACWRRTINIEGVFILQENIKISILGDHFMGSSHCDHQQQSWSRWHWNSGKNESLDFLFTLIAGWEPDWSDIWGAEQQRDIDENLLKHLVRRKLFHRSQRFPGDCFHSLFKIQKK